MKFLMKLWIEITLKKLKILVLDGNSQIDLSDLFKKLNLLKQPITLSMQNCKINMLPNEVSECDKIMELDLSFNNLKTIPIEAFKLKNLKTLRLSYNELTTVPESILLAKNLEYLKR